MQLYIAMNRGFVALDEIQRSALTPGSGMFWLAVALTVAVAAICGMVTGMVFHSTGTQLAKTFLYGFSAGGVALGLGLAFLNLLV